MTLTGMRTHDQSAFTPKSTTGSKINHASGEPHSGMTPELDTGVGSHLIIVSEP
jgi:hypothetical protein